MFYEVQSCWLICFLVSQWSFVCYSLDFGRFIGCECRSHLFINNAIVFKLEFRWGIYIKFTEGVVVCSFVVDLWSRLELGAFHIRSKRGFLFSWGYFLL